MLKVTQPANQQPRKRKVLVGHSTFGCRLIVLSNQRAVTDGRARACGQTTQFTFSVYRVFMVFSINKASSAIVLFRFGDRDVAIYPHACKLIADWLSGLAVVRTWSTYEVVSSKVVFQQENFFWTLWNGCNRKGKTFGHLLSETTIAKSVRKFWVTPPSSLYNSYFLRTAIKFAAVWPSRH